MAKSIHGSIPADKYMDLFYMTPRLVTAKELAACLQEDKGITVQLWEEMNILELELANKDSVDFEPQSTDFGDPSDAAFVQSRNIQTIFSINLKEADLKNVLPYFNRIINSLSGFVCADSENFMPVYAGSAFV